MVIEKTEASNVGVCVSGSGREKDRRTVLILEEVKEHSWQQEGEELPAMLDFTEKGH